MTTLSPLPPAQRIPTLDIIRGVALCGILIMNMPGFGASFFAEADGSHLWSSPIDRFAEEARDMLFSGKFNSMFSMLFGIGFTLQFSRMQQADPARATQIYLRRLLVLGLFGLVHAMVFWTGDILHMYAAMGLLLLFPLRRVGNRTIAVLIALCFVYPLVSGSLRLLVMSPEIVSALVAKAKSFEASNNAAYGHGSFLDAAREHAREFTFFYDNRMSLWNQLGSWVQIGSTMLLGLLAGRLRWPQRIAELMPRVRKLQVVSLVVGIGCGALFTFIFATHHTPGPEPIKLLGSIAYWISRFALMVFYVLTIVRLAQRPEWARRLAPIAAAGRMPLTNYLMQTAICTTLFYGWGFGLWNRVGPALGFLLALGIFFVIQVPWSVWWLSRHPQGPLEWLWSRLTYGPARAGVASSVAG